MPGFKINSNSDGYMVNIVEGVLFVEDTRDSDCSFGGSREYQLVLAFLSSLC